MKIQKPSIKIYGSFIAITLRRGLRPGDGVNGRGFRRG
ncbi:lariocidin family lasso peptide [Xenorhabdus budapestensis]